MDRTAIEGFPYLSSEYALVSDIVATQLVEESRKRGRKKTLWSFSESIILLRLYLLTRLDIRHISHIIPFAEQSSIRRKLEELLGPEYYRYHVYEKFPTRLQACSGNDKITWGELRQHWPSTSKALVETRLRVVKDSQPKLAEILFSDPEAPVNELKVDALSNSTGKEPFKLSCSSASAARTQYPMPNSSSPFTITAQSVENLMPNISAPSLSLQDALFNVSNVTASSGDDEAGRLDMSFDPVLASGPLSNDNDYYGEEKEMAWQDDWVSLRSMQQHDVDMAENTASVPMVDTSLTTKPQIWNSRLQNRMSSVMLDSTMLKNRFSQNSAHTLSSTALSHLRSVAQMSIADSRRSSLIHSSMTNYQASPRPKEQIEPEIPSNRALQRLITTKAALRRLYPQPLSRSIGNQAEEKVFAEWVRPEMITPCRRRTDPLWRPCCDPIETAWPQKNEAKKELSATKCTSCGLTSAHYDAIASTESLSDSIMLGARRYRGAMDQLWEYPDHFGNTPLFFVANRPFDILEGIKSVLKHFATFNSYLKHKNDNLQNFLFCLNPLGLGPHLKDLHRLLKFITTFGEGIDLNHRDVQGQTFLHCLLHHRYFELSSQAIQILETIIAYYSIADCYDNLGRTFHQALGIQIRKPVSWAVWSKAALYLSLPEVDQFESDHLTHPTSFDDKGNTVLHWLIRNESSFSVDKKVLFDALLDSILTRNPQSVHFLDRFGETPLFVAVRLGKPRIVRRLLHTPGVRYNIENYVAVSLLSAARDELRLAERERTYGSLLRYTDILSCMIFVLDFDAGIPLPAPGHVFRGD